MICSDLDLPALTRIFGLQSPVFQSAVSMGLLKSSHVHARSVACQLSCSKVMSDSATPWTIAHQTPLSMGFSRQEHWSEKKKTTGVGCHSLLQGIFPTQELNPCLLHLLTSSSSSLTGGFFTTLPRVKPLKGTHIILTNIGLAKKLIWVFL